MNCTPLIRQATVEDVSRLSALATCVFLDTYAPEGIHAECDREVASVLDEASFAQRLRSPSSETLIIEKDDHLQEFVTTSCYPYFGRRDHRGRAGKQPAREAT
jgi:hypothetical protein